ncbi:MAG: hypothetical protein VYB98_05025, partial [Actinomycetota bacterium]|nr:hypothetical protein [Actinomycetota bacterium]
ARMASAQLIDAVKALRLENPEIGVKKIAASVKAQGLGGAKEGPLARCCVLRRHCGGAAACCGAAACGSEGGVGPRLVSAKSDSRVSAWPGARTAGERERGCTHPVTGR